MASTTSHTSWTWICLSLLIYTALRAQTVSASSGTVNKVGHRTVERTVELRTHSIHAPYIDQDLQNRWWDFGADAYINTNKHIRLTRAVPSQMGWLWSRLPLTPPNFIIEIEFKVWDYSESKHLYGDGMAIWLTTTRAQPGHVFGSINKFEGLGIFLDTYSNAEHPFGFPRISAMLGDGIKEYDYSSDGQDTAIGACSADFRRAKVATKLRITYVKDQLLDVKLQYKGWDEWTDCFTVEGVKLPVVPFLGISAMTGEVFDHHDVIAIDSYSALLSSPDSPRDSFKRPGPTYGAERGSSFFSRLVIVCVLGVIGWVGWQWWGKNKRRGTYGFGFDGGRGYKRF